MASGADPELARRRGAERRFLVYDFEAIDHLVSQLESDERAWSDWFARTGR